MKAPSSTRTIYTTFFSVDCTDLQDKVSGLLETGTKSEALTKRLSTYQETVVRGIFKDLGKKQVEVPVFCELKIPESNTAF